MYNLLFLFFYCFVFQFRYIWCVHVCAWQIALFIQPIKLGLSIYILLSLVRFHFIQTTANGSWEMQIAIFIGTNGHRQMQVTFTRTNAVMLSEVIFGFFSICIIKEYNFPVVLWKAPWFRTLSSVMEMLGNNYDVKITDLTNIQDFSSKEIREYQTETTHPQCAAYWPRIPCKVPYSNGGGRSSQSW